MSNNEMIMLPREVVGQAIRSLERYCFDVVVTKEVHAALHAALEQPQPDPAPYLYYDPANGDTWTQEAINDGCCLPDGLIALYTK